MCNSRSSLTKNTQAAHTGAKSDYEIRYASIFRDTTDDPVSSAVH